MARIEHLSTLGAMNPSDPPTHQNNVWLVGDESEVIVVDPAHDLDACIEAVAGRRVVAVICTHGHWDHARLAPEFAERVGASIYLSNADRFLWKQFTGLDDGFLPMSDGDTFEVASVTLEAFSTPGHTPGSMSLRVPALDVTLVGDAVFPGGVGATRWKYSSFDMAIMSARKIFEAPDDTLLLPGHGMPTTVGAEKPSLPQWAARGW